MSAFVYFIKFKPDLLKVGASKHPLLRMNQLMTSRGLRCPEFANLESAELIGCISGGFEREAEVHRALSAFSVDGTREWYHLCDESMAIVLSMGPELPDEKTKSLGAPVTFTMYGSEAEELKRLVKIECARLGIRVADAVLAACKDWTAKDGV